MKDTQQEEILRLHEKLEAAEQLLSSGAPNYTLKESRELLEKIYRRDAESKPKRIQ